MLGVTGTDRLFAQTHWPALFGIILGACFQPHCWMSQYLAFSPRYAHSMGFPPSWILAWGWWGPCCFCPRFSHFPTCRWCEASQLLPHMLPFFVSAPIPTSHSEIFPQPLQMLTTGRHTSASVKWLLCFTIRAAIFQHRCISWIRATCSKNEPDRPFWPEMNQPCFKIRPIRLCSANY